MTTKQATEPTWQQREHLRHLRSADAALTAYIGATGSDGADCLTDLLCDLMHWADHSGFVFARFLERAEQHYAMECIEAEPLSDR